MDRDNSLPELPVRHTHIFESICPQCGKMNWITRHRTTCRKCGASLKEIHIK